MNNNDFIKQIVVEPDIAYICLEELRHINEPIVIFPAGGIAIESQKSLKKLGIEITYFCDNSPQKVGKIVNNIQVISFNQLIKDHKESKIIVPVCAGASEIVESLITQGFESKNIISNVDFLYYSDKEKFLNDFTKNQYKYEGVYKLFEDEESKKVFINRLNYMHTRNPKYIQEIKSRSRQYFEEGIIDICEGTKFVDCGAYTSDTIEDLVTMYSDSVDRIYAFEPDEKNFEKLINNTKHIKGFKAYNLGVWNKKEVLYFDSANNGSSSVTDKGTVFVNVDSIDNILRDNKVTFIKMDIEGAELQALEGAQLTIKRDKPILAICVYHKPEDIYDIPSYIKKLVPEYNLYLRHYTDGYAETVCYAII